MLKLKKLLDKKRDEIIKRWVESLEIVYNYKRPREELFSTCSEAFDANYHVLINNNYQLINKFIDKITRLRLEVGIPLSKIQKAFELYREIVLEILLDNVKDLTDFLVFKNIIFVLNDCLSYTIHKFSDYFQSMHEQKIIEQKNRLQELVEIRTLELEKSEQKYKTLVEEIVDGFVVLYNKEILFINEAFAKMHDYKKEELIGKKFYKLIAPQDRKKIIKLYKKTFKEDNKKSRTIEYMRYTKYNKSYPTEILARKAEYGGRLCLIGICRDITYRVEMEKKIREAERMAYIGYITTSLSHEIRNPLSAVKLNLQILKSRLKLDPINQRRMDISIKEVNHLENILKEILDFAKPITLQKHKIAINELLRLCVDFLDPKLKEKNLKIIIKEHPKIPDIIGDKQKLEQVFMNLILNAIDVSKEGETIYIFKKIKNNIIEISVLDRGETISKDIRDKVFEPFFTTKSYGTGLGLTNAKKIVEAHGGSLEYKEAKPYGNIFKVTLPLKLDYSIDN